jgi:hypothetical protein
MKYDIVAQFIINNFLDVRGIYYTTYILSRKNIFSFMWCDLGAEGDFMKA